MPSTIHVYVETDGERHGGTSIEVPDLPPDLGSGSRLRAERLAAQGITAIAEALNRETDA